eukprot:s42_g14.t1
MICPNETCIFRGFFFTCHRLSFARQGVRLCFVTRFWPDLSCDLLCLPLRRAGAESGVGELRNMVLAGKTSVEKSRELQVLPSPPCLLGMILGCCFRPKRNRGSSQFAPAVPPRNVPKHSGRLVPLTIQGDCAWRSCAVAAGRIIFWKCLDTWEEVGGRTAPIR